MWLLSILVLVVSLDFLECPGPLEAMTRYHTVGELPGQVENGSYQPPGAP